MGHRRTRRLFGSPVAFVALVIGVVALAQAEEPSEVAAPLAAKPTAAAKFNHEQHAKLPGSVVSPVTEESCQSCHPTDKVGTLTSPGTSGHQPCLASGCHVEDFLAISANRKKKSPERFRKAAKFCAGCHTSPDGEPPVNYSKPAADNVFRNNPAPNYHVELDHFEHISKDIKGRGTVGCRDCHVVDAATNELVLDSPGHGQCATCHGVTAPPMSDCAQCHAQPGGAAYFAVQRKGSEVRSCGSKGHAKEARRRGKKPEKVSCFKHETKRHRFGADGKRLECGACHYMFTAKKYWKKKARYDSIKNIKAAPVIDNQRDLAHRMCGSSSACHSRDVRLGSSGRQCKLCHSNKLIEDSLFE